MKHIFATMVALIGIAGAAPAHSEVDINIGIGIPGMIYTTPGHSHHGHYHRPAHPHSPRVIIDQPNIVVVPGAVWYGDARDYRRPYRHFDHGTRHRGKHHHPGRGKHRD